MKTLNQLSHDTYYNMGNYHQITIDFVEETEYVIERFDHTSSYERHLERLVALCYRIRVIKEISDKIGITPDLEALEILEKTIKGRIEELTETVK